jgi:hypothetical protein
MTITTIPVPTTTDAFTQQVEIGNIVYDMKFLWNARDHHWSITIGREGTDIVNGIKLIISDDLLAYARRVDGLPPGRIMVVDLDDLDRDPDETLFGDRVVLMYDDTTV